MKLLILWLSLHEPRFFLPHIQQLGLDDDLTRLCKLQFLSELLPSMSTIQSGLRDESPNNSETQEPAFIEPMQCERLRPASGREVNFRVQIRRLSLHRGEARERGHALLSPAKGAR